MVKTMKPKIKCKADVENCLALVEAGLMKAEDVIEEINRIKNLNYDRAIIKEISTDRKTVTTLYLAEVDEGSAAKVGTVDVIVRSVEHVQGEPDEHGNVSFVESVITVNKAVTAGAETFDLVNVPSIYEQLDITEAELDEALEELQK